MAKVYQIKQFDMDATPDNWILGKRMATEKAAKRLRCEIIPSTGTEAKDSELDEDGMYPPKSRTP